MLIRTVGLALLVALCVIEWKDKNYKNIGILSLSLLLPVAWWVLKNIQGYQSGYLKSLWWKIFPSPPEYLQTTIGENLVAFWQAWVSLFDLYGSQSSSFVLAPMLFLAAVVCVIRVGRGRADAVYVLLYLSVICFWPHEAHMQRFLYPIAPLLLIFFLFGIQPLVKSVSSGLRVVLTMAFMTAILIVSLPSGVQLAQRLYNPPSDPAFARSEFWINARPISEVKKQLIFQSALFDSMQELGYLVPEGDCIYALEPALVMFHLDLDS